jgi:hypothetical protein
MIPGFCTSGLVAAASWIRGKLAAVYNLFPLGGTAGGIVVRQKGGLAGTNEFQAYNDGSQSVINSPGQQLAVFNGMGNNGIICRSGKLDLYAGGGANAQLDNSTSTFALSSGWQLAWTSSGVATGTRDGCLKRLAAAVLGVTNASAGAGWLQNTAGRARNTADVTNATATMLNLADLTITLIAGRKYTGRMSVKCINSTAVDGIAFDFNGGTSTITSFAAGAGILASGGTDVVGTNITTALATAITFTTLTGESWVVIDITMVCNAAGTFIPRFAASNATTGTATVRLNSFLWVEDTP